MQLWCSRCEHLVDVSSVVRSGVVNSRQHDSYVEGSCSDIIDVKVIPFDLAEQGLRLCAENARSLLSTADVLRRGNDQPHALFLILTAYEELAKCRNILNAAHSSYSSHNPLLIEQSLFSHHETKYKMTIDYLNDWISTWDDIRAGLRPSLPRLDTPELQTERRQIRDNGFKLRMSCLYVDFKSDQTRWVPTASVTSDRVDRNWEMANSMLLGFENSLADFTTAIS